MTTYILKDTKKNVNNFCFLGSILEHNGTYNLEMEKRIAMTVKLLKC
jgi:hypothetical protein